MEKTPPPGDRHLDPHHASGLVRAAEAYLDSTLPEGRPASLPTIEALLVARPGRITALAPDDRRLVATAMILARARFGSAEEAVRLAEGETARELLERDASLPATTLAHFWTAVAEAYASVGLSRHGSQAARRAYEHGLVAGADTLLYRALGVLAANRALSGEFALTEEALTRASALEDAHGWQLTPAAYLLLVGQILLRSGRLDATGLSHCARRLRATLPGDPTWRALAALADAMAHLLRGRHSEGIAAIVSITNGADQRSLPRLVRDFLLSLHATLLIARGNPRRALALLEDRKPSHDHTLCFEVQRASAYLHLGDNRRALTTTDACLRHGLEHCLRTLPPILLRRAVASERLGNRRSADTAFADAFHLMHRSGGIVALLTLPRTEIDLLLDRLQERRPDLAPAVNDLRHRLRRMLPAEAARPVPPSLTNRETLVARRLRGPQTLAAIADSLFVTRDTVKSQATSLYRKLGVASRQEAVAFLERTGFYDDVS